MDYHKVHPWARYCSYFTLMIFRWQTSLRQLHLPKVHTWQLYQSITDLECMVNRELIKIDGWLMINKLSVNISKSCYMLINNQLNKSCELNFQLSLNSFSLTRQQTNKYLGVFIDDNLKWYTHIHHLSLQHSC